MIRFDFSRGWTAWVVLCGVCFFGLAARGQDNGGLPVLTTFEQVRALAREEANKGYPVELRGIVTMVDQWLAMTIVQAGEEGIYIRTPAAEEKLQTGDEVIVNATTIGSFHNLLGAAQFRVIGSNRPLPEPLRIEGEMLTSPQIDSRYGTVSGTVEQFKQEGGRWTFWVRQGASAFTIQLGKAPNNPKMETWPGTKITATGVGTMKSLNGVSTGQMRFLCASMADIQVDAPPAAPVPIRIADLPNYAATDVRVMLNGRITISTNGPFLSDETGQIAVNTPRVVREGDGVAVSGFATTHGKGAGIAISDVQLTLRQADGTMRPVFTSIPKIRALTRGEALKAAPVRVRGVITYYDPQFHELFIHNGDEGIYVSLERLDDTLRAGDFVVVTGVTGGGLFAPVIERAEAAQTGQRELPPAKVVSVPELLSGQYDSQAVEISGVVRQAHNFTGPLELVVMTRSGALNVRLAGELKDALPLVNSVVRMRGVGSGQFNENGQIFGARIFVPGINAITVEAPAEADPFSAKPLALDELFRFRGESEFNRRSLVTGTVTWAPAEGGVYLEGDGASIFVDAPRDEQIRIGSRVEAVGYPETGHARFAPYLQNALVRVVGAAAEPVAKPITADEIRIWKCDAALVTVRARLLHAYFREGKWRSIWKTEGENPLVFEATGEVSFAGALAIDAVCALTGIARLQMDDHRQAVGFSMNLRAAGDVTVLAAPPWWNGARARRGAYVLGLLVAVSGGWALILRKRVEQQTALVRQQLHEQQELQQRYRDLFENNPQPMWVFDPATLRYLAVNDTAIQRYGYSRAEFLAMSMLEMRPDSEKQRLVDAFKSGWGGDNQEGSHWIHRLKNGTLVSVEITSRTITFDGRQAKLVLAHDVTERVKAEAALRESEARFRRVIESNLIGIVFLDDGANVTDANDVFLKMLGLTRACFAAGPVKSATLIAPESLALTRDAVANLRAGGSVTPFEIECLRADQARVPALVGAVSLGPGAGFVGFVIDISREVALQQQVRLAQKMEAVGLLAGGVAHDFNNLLQVIQGYTLLSLESAAHDPDLQDYLQQVSGAAERGAQLTRQLLAFSRQQDLQEVDLDLGATLTETLKLVNRIIGEHIQVTCFAAPGLSTIRADKGRIEQVILNLCVNARDAMPQGGKLSIHAHNVTLSAADLGSNAAAAGAYVCLRVTDTGCGMDSTTTSRIFEPFFTTKPKDKGTGLGLSVVYGIVEKHKGVIRVRSQVGVGTTFQVYFPAAHAPAPTISTFDKPDFADKTGVETILLVEDEPAVRLLASRILERAGYDVRTAADGVEACSVFEQHGSEIDLILMDVIMPKMGGREAYEHIAKTRGDVPVIFCTGYSERELGADFLNHHHLDLLPKPYRPDELLTRIRERLGSPTTR